MPRSTAVFIDIDQRETVSAVSVTVAARGRDVEPRRDVPAEIAVEFFVVGGFGEHRDGSLRLLHLSPLAAVLSREKSHIDELQLIEGEFWFWLAGIDWRRLVDFCDRNSREKALANQFSEAQVQHPQGVQSASDFYREPQSRLPCV